MQQSLSDIFGANQCRFNWAARKLHKRLAQLGANELYPRGEADEQHEEGYIVFRHMHYSI